MSHILNQFKNHKDRHINGGSDVIDGDKVDITFVPTNYTRTTTPPEVDALAQLTAHLAGIDDTLGSVIIEGASLYLGIITTSSANYTPLSTDTTILCDCSLNNVIVDLPDVVLSFGRILNVKKISGPNNVTIEPFGAELISGQPNLPITVTWDSYQIQSNGVSWYIT